MFTHTKRFQYNAKPDAPDPIFAKQMQELIGGQWGEMSVMVNYLFQGWNCRGPAKYRDMLLDTATEEIGHVEMIATMVARLLETSPVEAEKAAENGGDGGVVGAVLGGGDAQQAIVNAESQGRLQVARLYQLTQDAGVRDMFSFLLARDTMHQNQWLAAIEELKADGLEDTPVPSNFPQEREMSEVAYKFQNFSEGTESQEGRWASGPSMDGKGEFEYVAEPEAMGPEMDELDPPVEPQLYSTPKQPMSPASS